MKEYQISRILNREIPNLFRLNHKNIVKITEFFENPQFIIIVYDLCHSDLYNYVKGYIFLSLSKKNKF